MVSVIFSTALLGLGRAAGAVSKIVGLFSSQEHFEISQDGEALYCCEGRYDFVGFSPNGSYDTPLGEHLRAGRCIGHIDNDDNRKVFLLEGEYDRYVMLQNISDSSEVYKLSA